MGQSANKKETEFQSRLFQKITVVESDCVDTQDLYQGRSLI